MKKVLLVALAVLLTLSFTACAFAEELPDASDLTVAGIGRGASDKSGL